MMRRLSYTALLLLSLAACTKTGTVIPDGPGSDMPISFRPDIGQSKASTKALLEPSNFNSAGNQITVFDKHSSADGQSYTLYINGATATSNGATVWPMDNTYYWTNTGTHSFTAYTGKYTVSKSDGTPFTLFAPTTGYDSSTEELSISDWTLSTSNQFDFCYARHTRSMSETAPYRPVALEMQHLLCAVQFNVNNTIPQASLDATNIFLNSFTVTGLHDTASATIGISGATISSQSPSSKSTSVSGLTAPLYLNTAYNVLRDIGQIGSDGFMLMWPHDKTCLQDVKVSISYTNSNTPTSATDISLYTSSVREWSAGKKYIYNFDITDNNITFTVRVVDWIYDDIILDE